MCRDKHSSGQRNAANTRGREQVGAKSCMGHSATILSTLKTCAGRSIPLARGMQQVHRDDNRRENKLNHACDIVLSL